MNSRISEYLLTFKNQWGLRGCGIWSAGTGHLIFFGGGGGGGGGGGVGGCALIVSR